MRIAICDDDPDNRAQIEQYVSEFLKSKNYNFRIEAFASGEELIRRNEKYDIAFVDIEMPGINGIGVSKYIINKNPNAIILIVTFHSGYLDDAMDLSVYRYITKPIERQRIVESLSRAVKKYYLMTKPVVFNIFDEVIKINSCDIIYISIENRKVIIHTAENNYETSKSISYWREALNKDLFAQPHTSYIVNLRYVESFDKKIARLSCRGKKYQVYVSQRKYAEFKKTFYAFLEGVKC